MNTLGFTQELPNGTRGSYGGTQFDSGVVEQEVTHDALQVH
jgi:hypothetical protein